MSKLLEFYNLKSLVRYNTRLKITSETVAEHSYFVSLFSMMICDELQVSNNIRLAAIEYALIHDIPEIDTSDIPYPVKKANPELKAILDIQEQKSIKERLGLRYLALFVCIEEAEDKNDEIVQSIVKLADALSVIQYCENEIALGNTQMEEIYEDACERVRVLKMKLFDLTKKRVLLGEC